MTREMVMLSRIRIRNGNRAYELLTENLPNLETKYRKYDAFNILYTTITPFEMVRELC